MSFTPHKVKCPTCKKDTMYEEANPYRPFCSKHCKTIDLGSWACGEYRFEVKPENEGELEQLLEVIAQKHKMD